MLFWLKLKRPALSLWVKAVRPRLRTAEATLWLLLAHALIRFVALRYWRFSLGRVANSPLASQCVDIQTDIRSINRVANSVVSGTRRLPFRTLCLPRAMAVQWMLRRRGHASNLIFGIAQGRDIGHLHAWVTAGGKTVIGDNADRIYHPGLTMVQP